VKLKVKFYLLVVSVSVITLSLVAFLLVNFSGIITIMEYQKDLLENQSYFQDLISYTDDVQLRGVEVQNLSKEWEQRIVVIEESIKNIQDNPVRKKLTPEANELIEQALNSWGVLAPHLDSLSRSYEEIVALEYSSQLISRIHQSGFISGIASIGEMEDTTYLKYKLSVAANVTAIIQMVYEIFEKRYAQVTESLSVYVDSIVARFTLISLLSSLIALVAVFFAVMILSRRLVRRVIVTQKMASMMSDKDLTSRLKEEGHDEIADLMGNLNITVDIFNSFFKSVKESSDVAKTKGQSINSAAAETASATHEINSNVESLRKQFDVLDTAVKQTIKSLTDMSGAAKTLVENNQNQALLIKDSNTAIGQIAQTVEVISSQAEEKARSAKEIQFLVADGDEKMTAANTLLDETTEQLDEISEVISIINGIAEQTNILSMNAAIESAHAGESGKGFAVVAEEIRTLAESTTENSKRISTAIMAIIKNVKEAGMSSKEAAKAFLRVSGQAKDMMTALQDITAGIQNVDTQTKHITAMTNQIAQLTDKITHFSGKLTSSQSLTYEQVHTMGDIFAEALTGIQEIKAGTDDIVARMTEVNSLSSDSYDKMTDLGASLSQFVTK